MTQKSILSRDELTALLLRLCEPLGVGRVIVESDPAMPGAWLVGAFDFSGQYEEADVRERVLVAQDELQRMYALG